ncbi:glycosyltransferase [Cryobacterium sp. Hb1]|uniref:glycosyltransferase n=1 Tax=Cryobacterium sp. Hb1 TaxID=1259147 RepID=UPI00106BB59D|nr:glycosyltransferase [Cryobacterium sp. Hb1]TFD70133.1 glycosyltransferase [Cryobacterium sp. Hb1]
MKSLNERYIVLINKSLATCKSEPTQLRIGVLASVGRTLDMFFLEMVAEWRRNGVEVFLAAGDAAETIESDIIHGLTQAPHFSNILTPLSLALWARRRRLDVILTNTATASALVRVAPTSVPIVYFCHGLHWAENSEPALLWKGLESILMLRTRGAIVSNTEDERWMSQRLGNMHVVKSKYGVGVPLDRFPASELPALLPGDPIKIAWIGDLSERKRPFLALDVARDLRNAGVQFSLVMAGAGPLGTAVAKEINRSNLRDVVTLPGRKSSNELIAASHILLHTSRWEGLARVLLEAAAIGRNSYGFDVKGVRDAPRVATADDGDTTTLAAMIKFDIDAGLLPQASPDTSRMAIPIHADLVLKSIIRWLDGRTSTVG